MGGVVGLNIEACLSRPSAQGADKEALEYLLTTIETAAVRAMAEKREAEANKNR